jgi:hypothetical protein
VRNQRLRSSPTRSERLMSSYPRSAPSRREGSRPGVARQDCVTPGRQTAGIEGGEAVSDADGSGWVERWRKHRLTTRACRWSAALRRRVPARPRGLVRIAGGGPRGGPRTTAFTTALDCVVRGPGGWPSAPPSLRFRVARVSLWSPTTRPPHENLKSDLGRVVGLQSRPVSGG